MVKAEQPQQPGLLTGLLEAIQAGLQQQAQESQFKPASLDVKDLVSQPPGKVTSCGIVQSRCLRSRDMTQQLYTSRVL